MFKHYFELIEGVDIYPIISLLVFLIFFLGMAVWAFRVGKDYLKHMSEMPLDKDEDAHPF